MADSKYHQVAVPEHAGGSSFTRVGSFPSSSDPAPLPASFDKAKALAGVVSASRLTTSGHWTHTDGNRINTTVGNVVDVIHGTYFAYRSAAASPPGKTLAASWAESVYTQVGSPETPIGEPGASPSDPTGSPPDYSVAYKTSFGATDTATDVAEGDSKAVQGDVVTATWAARVITYAGSSGTPVPYVFTQTYAGKAATYNYTTNGNVTLNTATGGDVDATTKITGGGSSNTTTEVNGGHVTTTTTVTGGRSLTNTKADAITATNTAGAITNVNTAANIFNQNFGVQENLNEGAMFNVNIGFTTNVTIGGQYNVALPEKFDFTPASTEITGINTKISDLALKVSTAETDIAAAKTDISTAETKITAAETALSDVTTRIGAAETKISAEETRLTEVSTKVGECYNLFYLINCFGI